MTAMNCFCMRAGLLLKEKEKEQETNRTNKRRKRQMRRNDCNDFFAGALACYLLPTDKRGKHTQVKRGGQTRGGKTHWTQ